MDLATTVLNDATLALRLARLAAHKIPEAFCLGALVVGLDASRAKGIFVFAIYCLASPVGVAVGLVAGDADSTTAGILGGIAGGTVLASGVELLTGALAHGGTLGDRVVALGGMGLALALGTLD